MSLLDEITVLILTYNEEANIGRTLAALKAFPRILVLDSGSTDRTAEIVRGYPGARIEMRPFDNHAAQWNYGLALCREKTDWILALDADYCLPSSLVNEIAKLEPSAETEGFVARFRYLVHGHLLSGSLYPPVIVLYRADRAYYIQEGHTQRLQIGGRIAKLSTPINHDDRKPLSRWLTSQQRYAELEAEHHLSTPKHELRITDRIRREGWLLPLLVLPYTLIVKRCILDGWPGWYYTMQRTLAEIMIALEILDRRLRRRAPKTVEMRDEPASIRAPDRRDAT